MGGQSINQGLGIDSILDRSLDSVRKTGRIDMATGAEFFLYPIFSHFQLERRNIEYLAFFIAGDRDVGKVSATPLTAGYLACRSASRVIHHFESMAWMSWLTAWRFAGRFSEVLDKRGLGLTGRDVTVMAILMQPAFQEFEAFFHLKKGVL